MRWGQGLGCHFCGAPRGTFHQAKPARTANPCFPGNNRICPKQRASPGQTEGPRLQVQSGLSPEVSSEMTSSWDWCFVTLGESPAGAGRPDAADEGRCLGPCGPAPRQAWRPRKDPVSDYLTAPQSQHEAKMLQGLRESREAWAPKGSWHRFQQPLAWEHCNPGSSSGGWGGAGAYKPLVRTRL